MSQIVKKFIGNDQVGATKIDLENNSYIRSRNAANSADINMNKVNASDIIEVAVDVQHDANILASSDNTKDIGANATRFANIFTTFLRATSAASVGTGTTGAYVEASITLPSGTTTAGSYTAKNGTSGGRVGLFSQNEATANATATDDVRIETGNKTAGTGDSGTITIQPGTSAGGNRGSLNINARFVSAQGAAFISTGGIFKTSSAMTNGQLLIGSTGADPVAAAITAGSGITVTNAAGSITIAATGSGSTWNKENLTLNGTDITNQYKDLAFAVTSNSLMLSVNGVIQYEGTDYSLSIPGSVTRVTFLGDLATAGAAALVSGDILHVQYTH